jgi:hypothetical protein
MRKLAVGEAVAPAVSMACLALTRTTGVELSSGARVDTAAFAPGSRDVSSRTARNICRLSALLRPVNAPTSIATTP